VYNEGTYRLFIMQGNVSLGVRFVTETSYSGMF
jgi:hypothetical protein